MCQHCKGSGLEPNQAFTGGLEPDSSEEHKTKYEIIPKLDQEGHNFRLVKTFSEKLIEASEQNQVDENNLE